MYICYPVQRKPISNIVLVKDVQGQLYEDIKRSMILGHVIASI